MMESYNVAFRYTSEAGNYEGAIFWTSFKDKIAFDAWYNDSFRTRQTVVEEGVSEERCIELARSTPAHFYLRASLAEATEIIIAALGEGQ